MIDVGHTVECTAASYSGAVKVKVVSELMAGTPGGGGVEISNQDEGRFIPKSPNNHHENTILPKKKHCL